MREAPELSFQGTEKFQSKNTVQTWKGGGRRCNSAKLPLRKCTVHMNRKSTSGTGIAHVALSKPRGAITDTLVCFGCYSFLYGLGTDKKT